MKIDCHVHSIESLDGSSTLCMIAEKAKSNGIDAVFICDHNTVTLKEVIEIDGVKLLPGCEISCKGAHMLALCFDDTFDYSNDDKHSLPSIEEAINLIHKAGGLAVIAHPFAHPGKEKFNPDSISVQPDGCEVVNARGWMRNVNCNNEATSYAIKYNLFKTGGSDSHVIDEIGHAYMQVDCDDINDLKNALLSHKSDGVLVENTKRKYNGLSQFQFAKRMNSSSKKIRALAVMAKDIVLDILGK